MIEAGAVMQICNDNVLKVNILDYKIEDALNIPTSLSYYVHISESATGTLCRFEYKNKKLTIKFNTYTDEDGNILDEIDYRVIERKNVPKLKGANKHMSFVDCISTVNSWFAENVDILLGG